MKNDAVLLWIKLPSSIWKKDKILNICITYRETGQTTLTDISVEKMCRVKLNNILHFKDSCCAPSAGWKMFDGLTTHRLCPTVTQAPVKAFTVAITGIEQLSIRP